MHDEHPIEDHHLRACSRHLLRETCDLGNRLMQGEPPTHHETHEPLSGPYPACRERGEEPRGIDSARTVDPVNDASSCEMFHRPSLCNGPDAPTPAAGTCKALHPSMLGDEQRGRSARTFRSRTIGTCAASDCSFWVHDDPPDRCHRSRGSTSPPMGGLAEGEDG